MYILDVLGVSKMFVTCALTGAGALEIPMRIFNGWLADRRMISAYNHITLCMVVTGVTTLLCAIMSSHAGELYNVGPIQM